MGHFQTSVSTSVKLDQLPGPPCSTREAASQAQLGARQARRLGAVHRDGADLAVCGEGSVPALPCAFPEKVARAALSPVFRRERLGPFADRCVHLLWRCLGWEQLRALLPHPHAGALGLEARILGQTLRISSFHLLSVTVGELRSREEKGFAQISGRLWAN